jgi:cell wall-associated NlpC family hydrolase
MTPNPTTPQNCRPAAPPPANANATNAIPGDYLDLYRTAATKYRIPWNVLAAIGKVESDHGRGQGPGIRSGANTAGAMGPMQFLPTTWQTFGVDGNHDGTRNIYDPHDAIPSAARYLKHNGAPTQLTTALLAYNHSTDYARDVRAQADRYAHGHFQTTRTDCTKTTNTRTHTGSVQKIITYARAQIGKPYRWGGVGPDAFDCSGLVYAAYRSAGITIKRTTYTMWPAYPHIPKGQEQPGDLVFFAGTGTHSRPGHMGLITTAGKMIEARCTTCGPIKTTTYHNRPRLVGFARPLADNHLIERLG